MRDFYTGLGTALFQRCCISAGVWMKYLLRGTLNRRDAPELYAQGKEAYEIFKVAVFGGPSLVFCGKHEAGKRESVRTNFKTRRCVEVFWAMTPTRCTQSKKTSNRLAYFSIRGKAYERLYYTAPPQHVMRDVDFGNEHLLSLTISVKDENGDLFVFNAFRLKLIDIIYTISLSNVMLSAPLEKFNPQLTTFG